MEEPKKLFLLDAYALIFRAYYAFINRPITDKEGNNTSAIFGFVNTLDEILRNENPSHIAIAFDPPAATFRHEMYPEYKANRDATPEDIKRSVPIIKEIIGAYNIPIVEVIGYEADDVIGTLSKTAGMAGYQVYMMTPDKDYAQLVNENVFMYKPGRSGGEKEILGVEEVKEKFEVSSPDQIIDLLALMGDSADNVPGAPGIGPKTATKLLAQYETVEKLLDSTHLLKGKQKENLENFREQIELSKKLVTIDINVPVNVSVEEFERKSPNIEKLGDLFDKLDFRNLKKRILGVSAPKEPLQTSLFGSVTETQLNAGLPETELSTSDKFSKEKTNYKLITGKEELIKILPKLEKAKVLCFDTETSGLNPFKDVLIGIALSISEADAYYVSIESDDQAKEYIQLLNTCFNNSKSLKVGHNLKFDIHFLTKYGATICGPYFDTMIAHYLLKPDSRHKLDDVIFEELNYTMIHIEELIGKKGKNQISMKSLPPEKVVNYACEDADLTLRLYNHLEPKLKDEGLLDLAFDLEMPLLEVLFHMEQSGFNIDTEALNLFNSDLLEQIEAIKKQIFEQAGEEFNIASPRQLGVILFEKLKVTDKVRLTKTKQYSTGEDVLQKLVDKHPIINLILEFRSLTKLQSTYVSALPLLIESTTGKIHSSFNQTIAATGRLSSVNPNLQNIPIREERGREIRKSFIPSDNNHTLLAADYSQIELRLMAHLSQDEHMIEAFKQGADIHRSTAAKVFKVEEENVTREMRSQAKTANFGIIYGISAFGLAERLKISRSDAKQLIDSYFDNFPKVKSYMDDCVNEAKEKGYVKTMYDRKRYLPDIQSANATVRGFAERNAINSPIQGSAADIIKKAMINIDKKLVKYKTKMILQVHDELVFDVHNSELEEIKELVRQEMENAATISVPLTVDMGIGKNWLEAH